MTRERPSLRAKALSLLSRREYSRQELGKRLALYQRKISEEQSPEFDPNEINCLLDDFEARGWISEARYVESAINKLGKRYGRKRVVQNLREKGVSADSIDAALPQLKAISCDSAAAILKRKYPAPAANHEERAKRIRFLMARGFDYDVIRKVLAVSSSPEEEMTEW